MLRDARTFVGRWGELQILMNAIDRRRPAMVVAPPQSGKSSLLFHAVAAGGVLLDHDKLAAFYIDMAEFPNLDAVQTTIAEAFAPAGTPWLQAILRPDTAPLLVFDNIDAPQHAAQREEWLAQLANEAAAGRLRVIGSCCNARRLPTEWERVTLSPANQSFLSEYLDVTIPDGNHPNREDQAFMIAVSRGHLGTLITVLTLWYRAQHQAVFAWRPLAMTLNPPQQPESTAQVPVGASVALTVEDREVGADTIAKNPAHQTSKAVVPRVIAVPSGWVVLIALSIAVALWIWGRG